MYHLSDNRKIVLLVLYIPIIVHVTTLRMAKCEPGGDPHCLYEMSKIKYLAALKEPKVPQWAPFNVLTVMTNFGTGVVPFTSFEGSGPLDKALSMKFPSSYSIYCNRTTFSLTRSWRFAVLQDQTTRFVPYC